MTERFGAVDFDRFHLEELPARLAERPELSACLGDPRLRPLAISVPGTGSYTYSVGPEGLAIAPGDGSAATVVELAHGDWCDFRWELKTSFALFYAGLVTLVRGSMSQLFRWEPVLRAAFDGQRVYDLDDPSVPVDAAGRPLDLGRSFTLDDDDEIIRAFLDRAGFVHIRQVLSDDEVEVLRGDVEQAVSRARPDDRRSWWTTVDGVDVCNRVNYLNDQSAFIAGLGADERLLRIARLGGTDLREAADRLDGHSVVIKVPGASSGLADLPWHRDCGMGGHPVKCPLLNVGVQLDAATPAAGQLEMIAGSHLGTSRLPGAEEVAGLPVVALATRPGDVTVHFGHTLHAAPPPADRRAFGRRALYLTYVPPLTFEMVGPGQGYNDVLFTRDDGHVRHVRELSR